jgi:biopolymer transport protein ExbD
LTLIDLAWLVTIVTLCAAKFGIVSVRLPQLRAADPTGVAAAVPKGIEIAIATNGDLRLQGQPVVIDQLGPRVKAVGDPQRPLMISIDTSADGTGHTDRFVQLVEHFQRAGVQNPLRVRAKSQPNGTVPDAEKQEPVP